MIARCNGSDCNRTLTCKRYQLYKDDFLHHNHTVWMVNPFFKDDKCDLYIYDDKNDFSDKILKTIKDQLNKQKEQ